MKRYTLLLLALFGISQITQAQDDPYIWLEEVDSQKALEFVKNQSEATIDELSSEKYYQSIYDVNLEILNSDIRDIRNFTFNKNGDLTPHHFLTKPQK
ncbi:MAG: prolyl oligopeptidase [Saprospiraceae bacterium]|jgi:prolyl oligopeptidase